MFTPENMQPKAAPSSLPDVSITLKDLPSKSLAYPEGSSISYRPYTYGEVKKISQSKMDLRARLLVVLEGITCTFDKMKLTISDFLYIGLLRKISTLGGSKFFLPFDCPACGERNKVVMGLEDLEFDDLNLDSLPIYADVAGVERTFLPVTMAQYFDLVSKNKNLDEIAFQAKMMNGNFDENYKLIYNADREDGKTLEEVDHALYHGVKAIGKDCSSCGYHSKIDVEGEDTLILPFRESEEPTRSSVRIRTKASH